MRIIRGSHKGKILLPPAHLPVRPTTDMAKEGIFNVMEHAWEMEGLNVLDLFAGTGNISLEFCSRGAGRVTAIDQNSRCTEWIQKASQGLGFTNLSVVRQEVFAFLPSLRQRFDIIFADPPFDLKGLSRLPDLIFEHSLLHPGGWFILEHPGEYDFSAHPRFISHKMYGRVHFSIFEAE